MTVVTAPVAVGGKLPPPAPSAKRSRFWPSVFFIAGALYFLTPLVATGYWSLKAEKDKLGFEAYRRIFDDPEFARSFLESIVNAAAAIVLSLLIIVPTAYWVTLRIPRLRTVVEFITLLPFVIPGVVLVFGLIRLYSRPPLLLTATYGSSRVLLVCAYACLSFPYMYRSVDNGLRALNVRSLTEAAQSLGAGWATIITRIILPNLRVALLSGALLTFAIVIGELTIALYMAQRTFGPFMADLVRNKVYEPAAVAIVAFALTWAAMGVIAWLTRARKTVAR